MTLAYSFFGGLFVTVLAIAVLARLAAAFGIIDRPGPRKIHDVPIPRIGGIAIALSTVVALALWLPLDQKLLAFLGGSLIVLATGVWDDIRPLDYRWKLLGQAIGISVLLLGGVHFDRLPFFGLEPVSAAVAYSVSFLFLLGVTNAFNLFDGLDGLAGGCIVLSIATICVLAILAGDPKVPAIGLALMGGVLGFLRYNTHPAAIFMGDAGSQFLGFAAGYLSIVLITESSPALNPALPFLVLGLPLVDTFSVALRRLLQRRSPFKGDRQHLHHRLMARGMSHARTVSALYAIQLAMAGAAFATRYQSDALVVALLVAFGLAIFVPLYGLERADVGFGRNGRREPAANGGARLLSRKLAPLAKHGPAIAAWLILPFLVAAAALAKAAPRDLAFLCLAVALTGLFGMVLMGAWRAFFIRLSAYFSCLVVCFLSIRGGSVASIWENWQINLYLTLLGAVVILSIVFSRDEGFKLSPQDLLMALMVIAVPSMDLGRYFEFPLGTLLLQVAVLFYALEYVLSMRRSIRSLVPIAGSGALLIVGVRGYL